MTDLDAGIDAEESVAREEVFKVFAENTERLRRIVLDAIGMLPEGVDSPSARALDGILLPFDLP
ncbi:hypothetical protein ABZW18_03770 [Streptomyces sp. NPDC004647]|uniref:hypothetical protein n=1 Tax=Streptomyces sp. NPDC004647 TaxID=3154671 RepID=UPI0033BF3FF1